MSRASKSVNAAYIRSALEVKAQRDETLVVLRGLVHALKGHGWDDPNLDPNCVEASTLKCAHAIIKKAKKWT